jgi:guanine nucleotide-binding protein G(i) subunit alpha
MGCSVSKDSAEGRARSNTNREIETLLHDDWMHTNDTVQLLLIGSAGSGKTTLFETVKHGHGLKLTEKQRKEHVYYIHCALVHAMKVLIVQGEALDILPSERAANREIDLIKTVDEKEGIDIATLDALQTLWADTAIQDVWKERYEFQINDSVSHLFRRIDRMKAPDYLPDDADIEYSQARITGVVTETYKIRGSYFQISDVSGQRRTTRRKWIHCFEEVSAIVFVAALSDYDEVLEGDRRMNKLVSFALWFSVLTVF